METKLNFVPLTWSPTGGWGCGETHNAGKAKIISWMVDQLRQFQFVPPLSSGCDQHQENNKQADLYLVVRCVWMAAALALMYNWVNVFSSTVSATLLYIPLTEPCDHTPTPQLQPVLTSLPLIRMLVWRWHCESRLAPADEWTEMAWMK